MSDKKRFVIRKFNGDDHYSWAIFRSGDLPKGHRGIVFLNEAHPITSGMDRTDARYTVENLNKKR
jgi:hypothetical protein